MSFIFCCAITERRYLLLKVVLLPPLACGCRLVASWSKSSCPGESTWSTSTKPSSAATTSSSKIDVTVVDCELASNELAVGLISPLPVISHVAFRSGQALSMPGGTRNFKTESPNICGNWNAVWHTTPPNAKLLTMSISENGSCTQTYYYANRGENVTYTCNYVYNYPTLTLNKDNGDVQHWEITDYTPNSMTLQASDGFCYYLSK